MMKILDFEWKKVREENSVATVASTIIIVVMKTVFCSVCLSVSVSAIMTCRPDFLLPF